MSGEGGERQAIHDVVVELFVAVDDKAWERARALMADTVAFDVTSLAGGEAGDVPADDIVAGWREGLASVLHVHHQAGNFRYRISGGRAQVQCYGTAYHYTRGDSGDTITTFVGSYDLGLERTERGWLVNGLRYNNRFVDTRPAGG